MIDISRYRFDILSMLWRGRVMVYNDQPVMSIHGRLQTDMGLRICSDLKCEGLTCFSDPHVIWPWDWIHLCDHQPRNGRQQRLRYNQRMAWR
jgi:hypothetical protein